MGVRQGPEAAMAWRSGRALGQDLRDRVLADAGRPAREVAARFGVSASYVVKARQRLRDQGDAAARPQRNRVAPRLAGHEEAIRAELARRPSATCAELQAWAAAARGVAVSRTAVWRTLARLGLARKKSRSGPRSRTAPT
jgi:transposase